MDYFQNQFVFISEAHNIEFIRHTSFERILNLLMKHSKISYVYGIRTLRLRDSRIALRNSVSNLSAL
jgi:hypothetical protein